MKTLSREAIIRMTGTEVGSGGAGGGGNVNLAGYASEFWVEENYISKAFFNRIFEIYGPGEHSGDPDVQVEPNDTDTTISNIKALVGFWTEEYLSALGQNSEQGGGGITLNEPLASINNASLGTPSNGQTLIYTNNRWQYGTTGGGGSVTSIVAGTGLSGGTITTSGTIAINSTYQTYISHGESAYNALGNYLLKTAGVTAIVVGSGANADKIGVTINGSNSGWITVPFATKATTASKLSTVSKTAWGQTYWTSGGVPDSIDGNMTSVGDISFAASGKKIGGFLYFDTTNTRLGVNVSSPSYRLDVSGDTRISGLVGLGGAPDSSYRLNVVANTVSSVSHGIKVGGFSYLNGNTGISAPPNTNYTLNVGGYTKTTRLYLTDSVYFEYDSSNSGIRLVGAGFYADTYVSALGSNSGGGGGGGATLNEPLDGINNSGLGAPSPGTQTGAAIVFNGTNWTYSHSQGIVANYFDSIGYIRAINNITSTSGNLQITSGRAAIGGAVNTSYKLYVAGNICSNYMVLGDDATVGTVTCTTIKTLSSRGLSVQTSGNAPCYTNVAWSTSSDMRLKRVIEDITTDISNIAKAPIFNFEWIKGGNKALGTSAQYWQNIFPYAVLGDQNNYLSMDYGGVALAAAVITARRVVELEKKIKELESKLE